MEWKDAIFATVFLLQLIDRIMAGIKLANKLETTSTLLNNEFGHLRASVDDIDETLKRYAKKADDHERRLIVLEVQMTETSKQRLNRRNPLKNSDE